MANEIKKYKTIIWAKVEFGYDREVLYWEGSIEDFEEKLTYDYMIFPRHGDRRVPTTKIKDHAVLQPDDYEWILELRLFSLTLTKRAEVKRSISTFIKNIGREPTDNEINRFIQIALDPDILKKEKAEREKVEYKRLDKFERFKTSLVIKKQKVSKIVTWTIYWLSK